MSAEQEQMAVAPEGAADDYDLFVWWVSGVPDPEMHGRVWCDFNKRRGAHNVPREASLPASKIKPIFGRYHKDGFSPFLVISEGGQCAVEITRGRCLYVDGDNLPLPPMERWHVLPDFLVIRDDVHWHAYWRVTDLVCDDPDDPAQRKALRARFTHAQKRLIAEYGTDKEVADPSRVMRVPSFDHRKDEHNPIRVRLQLVGHEHDADRPDLWGHTLDELMAGLKEVPPEVDAWKLPEGADPVEFDKPGNVAEATGIIEAWKEPEQRGEKHHAMVALALRVVRDHAILPETASALMKAGMTWGSQSNPDGWSDEIDRACRDALRKGQNDIGCRDMATMFGPAIKALEDGEDVKKPINLAELLKLDFGPFDATKVRFGTRESVRDGISQPALEIGSKAHEKFAKVYRRGDFKNVPPPRYRIQNLIMEGEGTYLIGAAMGSYKSFVACEIAIALLSGNPCFGALEVIGPPAKHVAWFNAEGVNATMSKRWPGIERQRGLPELDGISMLAAVPELSSDDEIEAVKQRLRDEVAISGPLGAIIFDHLTRMGGSLDTHQALAGNRLVKLAEDLTREHGCPVIILAHTGKVVERGVAGSYAFEALTENVLFMEADELMERHRTPRPQQWAIIRVKRLKDDPDATDIYLEGVRAGPDFTLNVIDRERHDEIVAANKRLLTGRTVAAGGVPASTVAVAEVRADDAGYVRDCLVGLTAPMKTRALAERLVQGDTGRHLKTDDEGDQKLVRGKMRWLNERSNTSSARPQDRTLLDFCDVVRGVRSDEKLWRLPPEPTPSPPVDDDTF